jgi:tetratricopeptide (TPR) repeat protein
MGKYEEAKASITQARSMNSSRASLNNIEGLIELYLGNLDRALALAQEGMNLEGPKDALRLLSSGALRLQGRFQEAINALIYDPTRLSAAFGPANFKDIGYDQLGQRLILKMDQEVASIFPPGRELAMAEVFLDAGDTENLRRALDRAESEMQSNPAVQIIYLWLRACCCGLQEDATGTEKNLAQLRDLTTKLPNRSARFQTHYAAGRAYLSLQRTDLALSEFQAATNLALHPVERHSTDYWCARAVEAGGDRLRATALFHSVAQSQISSWMSADARKRLSNYQGGRQESDT